MLSRGLVLVAADRVDPDTIFGWLCAEVVNEDLVVHFIYVRKAFQDHGVGTTLIRELIEMEPDADRVIYTHQTKAGRRWAEKMAERSSETVGRPIEVGYNPYLLYRTT